jgi:hypothetical protein
VDLWIIFGIFFHKFTLHIDGVTMVTTLMMTENWSCDHLINRLELSEHEWLLVGGYLKNWQTLIANFWMKNLSFCPTSPIISIILSHIIYQLHVQMINYSFMWNCFISLAGVFLPEKLEKKTEKTFESGFRFGCKTKNFSISHTTASFWGSNFFST